MTRKKKAALSRQGVIDAALEEFSNHGYQGASLNRVCQEKNISKGKIYHYFRGKDELYLVCVEECFDRLTAYLEVLPETGELEIDKRLQIYFDARLNFFAENPIYLGVFLDVIFNTPDHLKDKIVKIRRDFDTLNLKVFKSMLNQAPLREDLNIDGIVEFLKMYMNFFNMSFKDVLSSDLSREEALKLHEERSHRQLNFMLYGILERGDSLGK